MNFSGERGDLSFEFSVRYVPTMLEEPLMLSRLGMRMLTQVHPRLAWKAATLWAWKGRGALSAYRKRLARDELFPPFLFFALTNACNLRCRGCWIESQGSPDSLSLEQVERAIAVAAENKAFFHTLLGGEPFLYPPLWEIIERHPECYFQIITNGQFMDEETVERIRTLGNVTPLISIDGLQERNDARRGAGTFEEAIAGCRRLQSRKILYGVATVVTGENMEEVLTESFVRRFIDLGAMYLWFYAYRPVGSDPAPELAIGKEKMLAFRRRLLELRKKMPIILIDTYWDARGVAACPASKALGFHIGPTGSVEPCPPLSFAREFLDDHQGDLHRSINESRLLRDFQSFVEKRTKGCVILEHPGELAEFFRRHEAIDTSGRDLLAELEASSPRTSHHLPGEEIPENTIFYRILKRHLFFGMGAYA
jgi:MoaA/NifB/PqqE/SkfB family radical SAM enzyme